MQQTNTVESSQYMCHTKSHRKHSQRAKMRPSIYLEIHAHCTGGT